MDWLASAWDLLANLDQHLTEWSTAMGPWFYAVMALVIFCETGLVVTPFLPGDSLLFGIGVLCAAPGSQIDPWLMGSILTAATLIGDNTNYWLGRTVGPRIFRSKDSKVLNSQHLERTQRFYDKHGGKTIVLARFIAVVRTFAPFVAGLGRMDYRRFIAYSAFGAGIWVWGFVLMGYWLGNRDWVRNNFSLIILAIMGVTILLVIVKAVNDRRRRNPAKIVL